MFLTDLIHFLKTTHLEAKKQEFPWSDESLAQYLTWAFSRDYLFIDSDENGLTGVLTVYLLPKPYNGTTDSVLPSDVEILKDEEGTKDICFMDGVFKNAKARKTIINKFMKRFPNWENQKKLAVRKGSVKELDNRYIQLTGGIL